MYLRSTSAAGVRFLAAIKEGRGLKRSAREAGVSKTIGYRWLRERYLGLRREGNSVVEATAELGFTTAKMLAWEADVTRDTDRHHLRVDVRAEDAFWVAFDRGQRMDLAAAVAGVSRSTGYRWIIKRFDRLRQDGLTVRACQERLRLTDSAAEVCERRRVARVQVTAKETRAAQHEAVVSSNRYADQASGALPSRAEKRRAERAVKYWQLMREGFSNAEACRLLGMHRRTGTGLRQAAHFQIPSLRIPPATTGRYLEARERLQIADLLRLGHSMRAIAAALGRHPSTIKRELDRHRDIEGRYLPRTADHDARAQRGRPKVHKLVINTKLRTMVQRKLNRCWSPEEICGWMKKTYPEDLTMRLCPETIYRALLLRENHGLHKRFASKLRTGRRIRKTRWRNRVGQGSRIRNMTMIDQRPAEVETRLEAGHWEGDLIIGIGSLSAMMTLRERKTHFGIIVNLPIDHTAASVNAAAITAFAALPRHLKRTLTWDQGVEMAAHQDFTTATGIPVFFCEPHSPWQRGANENFNGLARQYFPKGTNLALHSRAHVTHVMRELNQRPRKTLDYDTPQNRFKAERDTPKRALR
jgi:IS30 family transposase